MVLWVFDGNMVGKWTNEPCNGVDEVVNPFWVITGNNGGNMTYDYGLDHGELGEHFLVLTKHELNKQKI